MGTQEKIIQAILKHANVTTTQACYIKTASDDAKVAMDKLENLLASDQPLQTTTSDRCNTNTPFLIQ